MPLAFNTSLTTLRMSNNLFKTTNSINSTMRNLSSGIRLNSAADGAASLALSNKLEAKNSGLGVANNNIQMGVSTLQTCEGYLGGITGTLQRVRNLAVQSANGAYSNTERDMLNTEAQQLMTDIQKASNQNNREIGFQGNLLTKCPQLSGAEAIAQGYTVIKDVAGLQGMNSDLGGKYILMNDIDLSSLGVVNRAIITGIFAGTFNGNGYSIKNLTINSNANYSGLFGQTNGATLKNIFLENENINSTASYVGSLIGFAQATTIDNSASSNISVKGIGGVGGLVGYLAGTITSSYTTGNVAGTRFIGGLVGRQTSGVINSCYTTANVSGTQDIGGFVGLVDPPCTIKSCSSSGNVKGTLNVGGFTGSNSGNIDNTNFWNADSSGQSTSSGSASKMNNSTFYAKLTYPNSIDLTLQIGDGNNSNSAFSINNLRINLSQYLDISLTTTSNSLATISKIDALINYVSSTRSNIGANINVLSTKIDSNSTRKENMTASNSVLKDTDIASESAKLIKNQIYQKFTISMMQQTKTLHSNLILSLLSS